MKIVELDSIPIGNYETPDSLVKLFSIGQNMEELCRDSSGMGLAAAQVGLPWKFFVYWANYPDPNKKFDYMVDCEYEPVGENVSPSVEGCLSLKGKYFRLNRHNKVNVRGKKLLYEDQLVLEEFNCDFEGLIAVVLQHEIDHQIGREKMIDTIGRQIYLS